MAPSAMRLVIVIERSDAGWPIGEWARGRLHKLRTRLPVLFAALLTVLVATTANAADFVVSTTGDSGVGSLRQAIVDLNAAGTGNHTISFQSGIGTVSLATDLPPIMQTAQANTTIHGNGATIDGQSQAAIFFVAAGGVQIENLTLQNGHAVGGEGGGGRRGGGGGLGAGGALFVNQGANVTVIDVTFEDNQSTGGVGGRGYFTPNGGGGGGFRGTGGTSRGGGGGGGGFEGNGGAGAPTSTAGTGGGGLEADGGSPVGSIGGSGGGDEGGDGGNTGNPGSNGHSFGGGGGGGRLSSGGNGGDFGGGGGAGNSTGTSIGGNGGFGGGGGGGLDIGNQSGTSEFGGGSGGVDIYQGGNGGSGYGGAVFVREGGTLEIRQSTAIGSHVTAGLGGSSNLFGTYHGSDGEAAGSGIYVHTGVEVRFNVAGGMPDDHWTEEISGAGGIGKTGDGLLILDGSHNYSGPTTIYGGRLQIDATIDSTVIVNNSTTTQASGNGTVHALVNHGRVNPGSSIGTLHVATNYTQTATGRLEIEVNDAGTTPGTNVDLLDVVGDAQLAGTVHVVSAAGNYVIGTEYTYLNFNSRAGEFLRATDNLAFFDVVLGYTSSTAYFTLIEASADYTVWATTPNAYHVATYLDEVAGAATGEFANMLSELDQVTDNEAMPPSNNFPERSMDRALKSVYRTRRSTCKLWRAKCDRTCSPRTGRWQLSTEARRSCSSL